MNGKCQGREREKGGLLLEYMEISHLMPQWAMKWTEILQSQNNQMIWQKKENCSARKDGRDFRIMHKREFLSKAIQRYVKTYEYLGKIYTNVKRRRKIYRAARIYKYE